PRWRLADLTKEPAACPAAALDQTGLQECDAIGPHIKMPGRDGLAPLAEPGSCRPDSPCLMITGHGEYDLSVRALRSGAYDFIQKPIDRDDFVASLDRAIRAHALWRRVKGRQSALERCAGELEPVVEKLAGELPAAPVRGKP